ncbi:MAG: dTMP kinase [Bdellovibrionota bacterium]
MKQTNTLAPLITYEGIEGAGKSTQMFEVSKYFQQVCRRRVLITREPGGTPIAEKIRAILIHPEEENLDYKTEAYLMQAARVQHVQEVIIPGIKTHDLVLCDRFIDSSTAYQGVGRNLGVDWIEKLNAFSTQTLIPTLTFFIDIPVELSLERMLARKKGQRKNDRFESEQVDFYTAIRKAYIDIAQKNTNRIITLDGTLAKKDLIEQQITKIQEVLPT